MTHARRHGMLALALCCSGAHAGTRILPAADSVPENLLRIEVATDRALPDGLDMRFVRLLDGAGHPIPDAFLDFSLPSRDGHLTTVLLHPGRIKTGVGPNLLVGPALHEGGKVTLVITDPALHGTASRTWSVGPRASAAQSPADWTLSSPRAGTRDALQVVTGAALTHADAAMIAVDASGPGPLAGTASLSDDGRTWTFRPARPWTRQPHLLRVHPELEDVAGNRTCAAFEQLHLAAVTCGEARREITLRRGIYSRSSGTSGSSSHSRKR